ncbi:MAG: outer membrane beta-barrel protein [Campylobacterota bacterium]|nr:outer membrane beta-barrel protein [Campylobacterota bacterium]
MKIIYLILLFCSVALADRDGGPYIGIGYGMSKYDDDNLYKEQKIDSSKAIAIYGGAYINKHLGVELAYIDFNAGDHFTVIDNSDYKDDLHFKSLNVSTLVHYAFFDDILDFYAKFGVGEMKTNQTSSGGFTMLFGGGMGVRFSEMFGMKVAYDRYSLDYTDDMQDKKMYMDFVYTALEIQF